MQRTLSNPRIGDTHIYCLLYSCSKKIYQYTMSKIPKQSVIKTPGLRLIKEIY